MKIGLRTPSPTRTVKAKTTGKAKRIAKKAVNPVYGKKGTGYIKDPKRAVYNRFYHKLTVDPLDQIRHSEMPDIDLDIPEPAAKKFSWANLFSIIGSLSVIYVCYKLIFANELHLIWCATALVCYAAFFILRHYEI